MRLDWDFTAQRSAIGWQPTHDLSRFLFDGEGLHTRSVGGDPYMVGPSMNLDAQSAPHLEVHMRSTAGTDAQVFWEVAGKPFNEAASQHFTVIADGQWHTYRLSLKGQVTWQGSITRLRLDPSNQTNAQIAVAYIRALGPLPPELKVGTFGPLSALVQEKQPFTIQAVVVNIGDQPAEDVRLGLQTPAALALVEGQSEMATASLEAGQSLTLTWILQGPAGVHPVSLWQEGHPIGRSAVIVEKPDTEDVLALESGSLRLAFPRQPFGYGVGTLAWSDSGQWQIVGKIRSLGQIVYVSRDGQERQRLLYAPEAEVTADVLSFVATYTDEDGARWMSQVSFASAPDRPWFHLSYTLSTDRPVRLLAWSGPEYLAGEGAFGTRRESSLFPGLEFLMGDEQSSGTEYADPLVSARYVPHPNKVTIPLMAVTQAGMTTGLMWDPLQPWDGQHDRPAALFASPNTWDGQANHLMRLSVPGATAGLAENHDRLDRPFELEAGQTLRLTASLFVAPAQDPLTPLEIWLAANAPSGSSGDATPKFGLPALPTRPRSSADALRLCLENYTKITWVPSAKGWHYVLHDPWGPGSDPAIALHLWTRTLQSDLPARTVQDWRDMVHASESQPPAGGQPNPWFYQPSLALHTARPASAMGQMLDAPLSMVARQQPDGSWGFIPQDGPGRASGQAGDTSNGYVATFAFPILYIARITGDERWIESGLEALAYLEKQPLRPEGAQTWELSLHVPDLLASAWATQAFVEGYRLTGQTRYLDLAQRWAFAGLPFIYLWNPSDRPVMRYATIPVFGASNYTFPWFGRAVMWNGLDYAIGLQSLAVELEAAGLTPLLDWRHLAEGITIAAMQMQSSDGPYRGMYPDAWDVVTGSEAYSWWLTPVYLAHNLLMLQGETGVQVYTRILTVAGQQVHVNAVASILVTEVQGDLLTVKVRYHKGETSAILLSPLKGVPREVLVDGQQVSSTASWGKPSAAWSYEEGMLVVKVPFTSGEKATIVVRF